jgi:2-isopropylmalate synthase
LADKKHDIFDEDLQALVTEANLALENERVKLVFLSVGSQTGETPRAPHPIGGRQRAKGRGGR